MCVYVYVCMCMRVCFSLCRRDDEVFADFSGNVKRREGERRKLDAMRSSAEWVFVAGR